MNKLAYEAFGTEKYTDWKKTTPDKLKPGDAVRFNNNSHSIFITEVKGNNVTYGECNGDYKTCRIRWNLKTTKKMIKKTLTNVYSSPVLLRRKLCNCSKLSAKQGYYCEEIKITGASKGGTGKILYEYSVCPPNVKTWTIINNFSKNTKAYFTPDKIGKYIFRVRAKDSHGNIKNKSITLKVQYRPSKINLFVNQLHDSHIEPEGVGLFSSQFCRPC